MQRGIVHPWAVMEGIEHENYTLDRLRPRKCIVDVWPGLVGRTKRS